MNQLNNIEFSIGPNNDEDHKQILEWLENNDYKTSHVSHDGDHYSEIYTFGDYNKAYKYLQQFTLISIEHWEE